jgi:hypothetical protein
VSINSDFIIIIILECYIYRIVLCIEWFGGHSRSDSRTQRDVVDRESNFNKYNGLVSTESLTFNHPLFLFKCIVGVEQYKNANCVATAPLFTQQWLDCDPSVPNNSRSHRCSTTRREVHLASYDGGSVVAYCLSTTTEAHNRTVLCPGVVLGESVRCIVPISNRVAVSNNVSEIAALLQRDVRVRNESTEFVTSGVAVLNFSVDDIEVRRLETLFVAMLVPTLALFFLSNLSLYCFVDWANRTWALVVASLPQQATAGDDNAVRTYDFAYFVRSQAFDKSRVFDALLSQPSGLGAREYSPFVVLLLRCFVVVYVVTIASFVQRSALRRFR